jgi:hypothetical protein
MVIFEATPQAICYCPPARLNRTRSACHLGLRPPLAGCRGVVRIQIDGKPLNPQILTYQVRFGIMCKVRSLITSGFRAKFFDVFHGTLAISQLPYYKHSVGLPCRLFQNGTE